MLVIPSDAVILVRIDLLSKKYIFLFKGCTKEHRLLEMDIVILSTMKYKKFFVTKAFQIIENAALVVAFNAFRQKSQITFL